MLIRKRILKFETNVQTLIYLNTKPKIILLCVTPYIDYLIKSISYSSYHLVLGHIILVSIHI